MMLKHWMCVLFALVMLSGAQAQAQSADLSITQINLSGWAIAGNNVRYYLRVFNNGPADVTGARVLDTLPAALEAVSWNCTPFGGSCGASSGTGSIN